MGGKEKILIFQIASLGDSVIALPCYREIARRHPKAERFLLTNFPIGRKMVQAEALLAPCGVIHGSVEYPMPLRGAKNIAELHRRLRTLKIDVLYYLAAETRLSNLIRHFTFFKSCGVGEIRGVPWARDKRYPRAIGGGLWESEASRLLRTIGARNKAGPPDPAERCLELSFEERSAADRLLMTLPELGRFVAVSVGGKVPINDWGDGNWSVLLSRVSGAEPDLGVVFVGSADERGRNEFLAQVWKGPYLNACGDLTPRESAALIERADLFLGHDTSTLHLAAAVGTPIVGIFSARNVPGKWFSDRTGDRFFYNRPACFGCELVRVNQCQNNMVCMAGHRVEEIEQAILDGLARASFSHISYSASTVNGSVE